jgi:hypothetical protein
MWVTVDPVMANGPIESGVVAHPFGNWPALVVDPRGRLDQLDDFRQWGASARAGRGGFVRSRQLGRE